MHSEQSIPAAFLQCCKKYPSEICYKQVQALPNPDILIGERYLEVQSKVAKIAAYLKSIGVKNGDKIAIISGTRPEWMIADLAILSLGGITVSVYHSVNVAETGYILFDSDSEIVFAENEEQVNKLLLLSTQPVKIPTTEDRPEKQVQLVFKKIITFEQTTLNPFIISISEIYQNFSETSLGFISDQIKELSAENVAALVYTSGTTGPPKGVIQTHGNHLSNLVQASRSGLFAPDGDIFLFLPLAHSFARLIGYIGFLTPTIVVFPSVQDKHSSHFNPQKMMDDLCIASSQVVPLVPRILEKMRDGIEAKSLVGGIAGKLLKLTLAAATEVYEKKEKASLISKIIYDGTKGIREKIKTKMFGPGFRHAVSGGAKLPAEINKFFDSLGITIYQGYGLTETCVATNVNRFGANVIGSVGPPLDGVELRIAEDGEILFKGPNVTKGYHNRPKATAEGWDREGWFHTGDLGALKDGVLWITGRKKEIIVTAGGKKVAPVPIEDLIKESPYISQAVVLGEGKPYCVAVITLNEPAVRIWAGQNGVDITGQLSASKDVIMLISAEFENTNKKLSQFETIKRFVIIDEEFTVENSLLTPTFKVKRGEVYKRYSAQIDGLY